MRMGSQLRLSNRVAELSASTSLRNAAHLTNDRKSRRPAALNHESIALSQPGTVSLAPPTQPNRLQMVRAPAI